MEVAVRPSRGIRHALDLMAAKSVVFFNPNYLLRNLVY